MVLFRPGSDNSKYIFHAVFIGRKETREKGDEFRWMTSLFMAPECIGVLVIYPKLEGSIWCVEKAYSGCGVTVLRRFDCQRFYLSATFQYKVLSKS